MIKHIAVLFTTMLLTSCLTNNVVPQQTSSITAISVDNSIGNNYAYQASTYNEELLFCGLIGCASQAVATSNLESLKSSANLTSASNAYDCPTGNGFCSPNGYKEQWGLSAINLANANKFLSTSTTLSNFVNSNNNSIKDYFGAKYANIGFVKGLVSTQNSGKDIVVAVLDTGVHANSSNTVFGNNLMKTATEGRFLKFDGDAAETSGLFYPTGSTLSGGVTGYVDGASVSLDTSGISNLYGKNIISYLAGTEVSAGLTEDGGHGTQVASVIAAQSGITEMIGVASSAKILPIRVLNGSSTTANNIGNATDIALGLEYASGTFSESVTGQGRGTTILTDTTKSIFAKYKDKGFNTSTGEECTSFGINCKSVIKALGTEKYIFEEKKADIVNISLSVGESDATCIANRKDCLYTKLQRAIISTKVRDILIIASAGNEGGKAANAFQQPVVPAYFAAYNQSKQGIGSAAAANYINDFNFKSAGGVIAVVALQQKLSNSTTLATGSDYGYTLATYSNWCGDTAFFCLAAPGGTAVGSGGVIVAKKDDTYARAAGTSLATPMVSGVAALVKGAYPYLTMSQVMRILLETATPMYDLDNSNTIIGGDLIGFNINGETVTAQTSGMTLTSGWSVASPTVAKCTIGTTSYQCYSKKYGRGMVNAYRAVAVPIGALTIVPQNGSTSSTAKIQTVSTTSTMSLPASFGDALTNTKSSANLLLSNIILFDQYGRNFAANISGQIKPATYNSIADEILFNNKTDSQTIASPTEIFGMGFRFTANSYKKGLDGQYLGIERHFANFNHETSDYDKSSINNLSFNKSLSEKLNWHANFSGETINQENQLRSFASIDRIDLIAFNSFSNPFVKMLGFGASSSSLSYNLNDKLEVSMTIANNGLIGSKDLAIVGNKAIVGNLYSSSATYQPTKNTLIQLGFGKMRENSTALGASGNDALSIGLSGATTNYYSAGFVHKLTDSTAIIANYTSGRSNVSSENEGIVRGFGNILSRSYSAGIITAINDQSQLGLIYSDPMRVVSGSANIVSPLAIDSSGQVYYGSINSSLKPFGHERNYEIFYSNKIDKNSSISLNIMARSEPNNFENAKSDLVRMIKFTKQF